MNTALKQSETLSSQAVFLSCSFRDLGQVEFVEKLISASSPVQCHPQVSDVAFTKVWAVRTKDRIRRSNAVICLIGEGSWLDQSLLWQLTYAYSIGKPVIAFNLSPKAEFIIPFPLIDRGAEVFEFSRPVLERLLDRLEARAPQRPTA